MYAHYDNSKICTSYRIIYFLLLFGGKSIKNKNGIFARKYKVAVLEYLVCMVSLRNIKILHSSWKRSSESCVQEALVILTTFEKRSISKHPVYCHRIFTAVIRPFINYGALVRWNVIEMKRM